MRVASRALTLGLWTQIWGKHPPLMASLGLTSIPVGDSNGGGGLGLGLYSLSGEGRQFFG